MCESGRHWALMIASNWRMLFCLSSSTSILTTPLVNHTLGSRSPAPRVHAAVRIIAETLVASRYPPLCTFIALCPQDTQPAPPTLPIVTLSRTCWWCQLHTGTHLGSCGVCVALACQSGIVLAVLLECDINLASGNRCAEKLFVD